MRHPCTQAGTSNHGVDNPALFIDTSDMPPRTDRRRATIHSKHSSTPITTPARSHADADSFDDDFDEVFETAEESFGHSSPPPLSPHLPTRPLKVMPCPVPMFVSSLFLQNLMVNFFSYRQTVYFY